MTPPESLRSSGCWWPISWDGGGGAVGTEAGGTGLPGSTEWWWQEGHHTALWEACGTRGPGEDQMHAGARPLHRTRFAYRWRLLRF